MRRPVVAVIGSGRATPEMEAAAERVGRGVVDLGARLVTGGLGGVMAAASRGARASARWRDGDVIGLLPGLDPSEANPWVDVALPLGTGHARNLAVVAGAAVVVLVGGEAGALSEVGLARKVGVPVVAVASSGGVAARVGGVLPPRLDVEVVPDAEAALERVARHLARAGHPLPDGS